MSLLDDDDDEVTRRSLLTALGAGAGGYVVAQRVKQDERDVLPTGSGEEVKIMPGEVQRTYYYPTIEAFESEIGEPDEYPAIVWTDSEVFAYDAA